MDTFAPEVDLFGFPPPSPGAHPVDSLDRARQLRESAQRLFDTVAATAEANAGAIAEEPSVTLSRPRPASGRRSGG